jgi:hypothetical protein
VNEIQKRKGLRKAQAGKGTNLFETTTELLLIQHVDFPFSLPPLPLVLGVNPEPCTC